MTYLGKKIDRLVHMFHAITCFLINNSVFLRQSSVFRSNSGCSPLVSVLAQAESCQLRDSLYGFS